MARLMLEPYNLLILDEPTNHMDMLSKDILKQALIKYDGTVVVISHDREFLDGLVDTVYEFRDGKVKEHLGGIYDFLRARKIENLKEVEAANKTTQDGKKATNAVTATQNAPLPGPQQPKQPEKPTMSYAQKKEQDRQRTKLRNSLQKIEAEIESLESKIKELDAQLIDPATYSNELFNQYNVTKSALESKMELWEQIQIEIENNG